MKVETICLDKDMANTYVVSHKNQAIIIDPANKLEQMEKAVGNNQVVGIFLTHGHYDHFKTLRETLDKYQVPLFLHKNAYLKLNDPRRSYSTFFGEEKGTEVDGGHLTFVKDGDTINLDNFTIKVWTTKGHTDCCICLFIGNILFTGDTIFKKYVGRTDLASSNSQELTTSIKRLMNLKDDYIIYPGHGPETSIFLEKEENYFYNKIKNFK